MKRFKKLISLILVFVMSLSVMAVSASAAESGIKDFSVTSVTEGKDISVKWWGASGRYYLFMPSDCDLSHLTVNYTASSDVELNGEVLKNGESLALDINTQYTLSCDGNSYSLYVLKSEGIPSLHISTESGSMDAVHADKSHKEPAGIVISWDGKIILEKELEYIKGRGNATWTYAKKPYNIKFDKKTSLFGMDKAKKWTLLANCVDETLMRNHTALSLAEKLGIPFTSEHIFVDLYINNDYYGNYILCESVEVGDGRVEITDLTDATEDANPEIDIEECELGGAQEKNYNRLAPGTQKWADIPNDPEDISGGYLLEYELPDRYVNEISGFITTRRQTVVVKEPEYASEAQVRYISSMYQEFEDALFSENGYNALGKHYSEYIDYESFVRMYVFQEYVKNLDAAMTSFYIYKDAGSDKFVAAPVWDFDEALGKDMIRYGMNIATPDGWWASVIYYIRVFANNLPSVLNMLYRKDDFFASACEEWKASFVPIITGGLVTELSEFADGLTPAAVMNAIRWNTFDTMGYDDTAETYKARVQTRLLDFLTGRKEFLDKGFSDTSVRVFYNANGGEGVMFNESAPQIGESITLPSCTFTHSSLVFDSWNTASDGSGITYNAGDSILLTSTKITLYAQWKQAPAPAPEEPEKKCDHMCHKSGFMGIVYKIFRLFWKLFNTNKYCECGVAHY